MDMGQKWKNNKSSKMHSKLIISVTISQKQFVVMEKSKHHTSEALKLMANRINGLASGKMHFAERNTLLWITAFSGEELP